MKIFFIKQIQSNKNCAILEKKLIRQEKMMITGTLKNKINAIWQAFYNENMANTLEIVNQLTTLMFVKMLDDKQNTVEAQGAMIGIQPRDEDLVFKSGNYKNDDLGIDVPYSKLRWKNFKNLNANDLAKTLKDYVFPFIKDTNSSGGFAFSKFTKNLTYGFDDRERLLASVVDKLSDEEFDFNNTDLMGDVYEYMCGSGVSGQYRTPRHIIDMAVEMMKPKLGEKIIDPAMGTAGFLVESAKYIKEHQKAELLNIQNNINFTDRMFYGCDNDSNMARIGYMNLVLHGVKNPIITKDSLLEGENSLDYLGKFDLVLANPPFSGSLVESATDSKLLTITKTKKTELLFVALMDKLLKVGGRCMTIVPDGVLYGSDTAHKALRMELINNQKLIGVVSMPNGIFSAPTKKGSASKGAGVKTSFIIFEKTNNGGTDGVWFYNMTNDGFTLDVKREPIEGTNIPDVIERFNNLEGEKTRTRKDVSFIVPVEEIRKNNYDLTINKYKEIEKETIEHRNEQEIINELAESHSRAEELMNSLLELISEKGE